MTARGAGATGIVAIVPLGADSPALRLTVGGRRVLDVTLDALGAVPELGRVVLAVAGHADGEAIGDDLAPRDVVAIARGPDRWAAMLAALRSVEGAAVLVQDPNRPLVTASSITAMIRGWDREAVAVLAGDVVSTVKQVEAGVIVRTVPREHFRSIQGTWLFPRERLAVALERAVVESWDVASELALAARAGMTVHASRGDPLNIDVAWPADAAVAELVLSSDVPGTRVTLTQPA
jgi:2-C-methyl-D-erythritol 4-phosphate cytidylyltransferase